MTELPDDVLTDDDGKPVVLNIDEDPDNANWPKRSLDLPGVVNVETLKQWIDDHGLTVEEFRQSPAYRLALRSGRYGWLRALV